MTTLEEFEAALVGATARSPYGTVVKTALSIVPWVGEVRYPGGIRSMKRHTSEDLVEQGYVLDPAPTGPATAREALDLAWNLAHPVKAGQTIPEGAFYLSKATNGTIRPFKALYDLEFYSTTSFRTIDPLPEPTPDWLDAPAVLAHTDNDHTRRIWTAGDEDQWASTSHTYTRKWRDLRDVTPLYPKEDA